MKIKFELYRSEGEAVLSSLFIDLVARENDAEAELIRIAAFQVASGLCDVVGFDVMQIWYNGFLSSLKDKGINAKTARTDSVIKMLKK